MGLFIFIDYLRKEILDVALLLASVAGVLFGSLGPDFRLQNEIVSLLVLGTAAYFAGRFLKVIRLPPLIGMLLVGMLLHSLLAEDISVGSSSAIRDCALTVILLKAGLGLDPVKLRRLKFAILSLSLLPCLSEAAAVVILSRIFLGLPWFWCLMIGFVVCAVSAAVLVPGMLDLDAKRLGTQKGISTLMLASVSLDNTVALAGFFVSFSIVTSDEIEVGALLVKCVEPFLGLLIGGAVGVLMWWVPCPATEKGILLWKRVAFLCLSGLSFTFMSKKFGMGGAGALSCVSCTFVASLNWRKDDKLFKDLVRVVGALWIFLEIFLFSLIGIQVTLQSLRHNIGSNLAILLLGMAVRFAFTFASVSVSDFNLKEKVFISASWISKATVQAAIGSLALEYMTSKKRNTEIDYGQQVLSICVLSIVLTAPIGALIVNHLGPLLLTQFEETQHLETVVATDDGVDKITQVAEEIAEVCYENRAFNTQPA